MTNQTKNLLLSRNYKKKKKKKKKKKERERKGYLLNGRSYFQTILPDKGLIAKIDKKLIQLNTTNDLIKERLVRGSK